MSAAVHLHLGSPIAQITTSVTHQHHYLPNSGPSGMSLSNFLTTVSKVLMNTLGRKVSRLQVFPSPSSVLCASHPEASVHPCSLAPASNVQSVRREQGTLCRTRYSWPALALPQLYPAQQPATTAPAYVPCQGLCYQGEGCIQEG